MVAGECLVITWGEKSSEHLPQHGSRARSVSIKPPKSSKTISFSVSIHFICTGIWWLRWESAGRSVYTCVCVCAEDPGCTKEICSLLKMSAIVCAAPPYSKTHSGHTQRQTCPCKMSTLCREPPPTKVKTAENRKSNVRISGSKRSRMAVSRQPRQSPS